MSEARIFSIQERYDGLSESTFSNRTMDMFYNNTTDVFESVNSNLNVAKIVIVSIIAAILSLVTAGGNLLVILSIKMDRNLQTITNYFLLSLSVADLTIGEKSIIVVIL